MFDAILYINLSHRKDRKESILKEIEKIHKNIELEHGAESSSKRVEVHRIDAVLEPLCGHIGCGKSHILALELAIQNKWSSVLILEDDFVFTKDYMPDSFTKIKDLNWDVMLLAKGYDNSKKSQYDFLRRACRTTTASGYIVRQHYYSTLLKNFQQSIVTMEKELRVHSEKCLSKNMPVTKLMICSAIDQYWFSLQEKDIFYIFDPPIGIQSGLWSDNNCSVDTQRALIGC